MGNTLQFIGDHQPISTMFNGQMISGYDTNAYSGQEISVSDTYNDNLDLTVFGRSKQDLDYIPLEYIESTGTQYIDTGYLLKSNVNDYHLFFQPMTDNLSTSLFGTEDIDGTGKRQFSGLIYNQGYTLWIGNSMNIPTGVQNLLNTETFNFFDMSVNNGNVKIKVNDFAETQYSYIGDVRVPKPIQLFGNGGAGSQNSSIRVKDFSIKDDGQEIIHLIPCRLKSNNEVGMWDLVSDTFFGNKGTGSFISGAEIATPSPDYPSSIHSAFDDGSQLLVTGSRPQQSTTPPVLRAIPVVPDYPDPTYVDESGQAWVADEWRSDGTVVRRIGVKVFDGSEPIVGGSHALYYSTPYIRTIYPTKLPCTHCNGLDKTDVLYFAKGSFGVYAIDVPTFKAFLASQYTAGTPVTVQYVLATPTTETIQPQLLRTNYQGTNISTSAAIKPQLTANIRTIHRT